MKILLTGGGTGGHLIPLISVVNAFKRHSPTVKFLFVGPVSDFNVSLQSAGVEVVEISSGKLRRYWSGENFRDIGRFFRGIWQAYFQVRKFKPDLIFSKGGFGSVPVVIAGKLQMVPIVMHESDVVPGLANRFTALLAKKVFVAFAGSEAYFNPSKTAVVGNPIRTDLSSGVPSRGWKMTGFSTDLPVLLIFGGSQGSEFINNLVIENLSHILLNFQVVHLCGKRNFMEKQQIVSQMQLPHLYRYKLYSYLDQELKDIYAIADMVVGRAGASSLSEVVSCKKPSLIIPLANSANNHQFFNAKYFADQGLVMLAEERELCVDNFSGYLQTLQMKRSTLQQNLQHYAQQNSLGDTSELIVGYILQNFSTNNDGR